jgi:hypothetical protein
MRDTAKHTDGTETQWIQGDSHASRGMTYRQRRAAGREEEANKTMKSKNIIIIGAAALGIGVAAAPVSSAEPEAVSDTPQATCDFLKANPNATWSTWATRRWAMGATQPELQRINAAAQQLCPAEMSR